MSRTTQPYLGVSTILAENESLDLGSSHAKRWDAALTAFQNGDACEKVAPKVTKALYGGPRKALKQFQEQGVTLADLLTARDSRQRLRRCAGKPLPRPASRHLVSTEVLADGCSAEAVTALLARYRDEWMSIASQASRKGFAWARLLAAAPSRKQGVIHASA